VVSHCIYLHGFASGPQSTKAKFFVDQLSKQGISSDVPDLNGGDFSKLTISNQIEIVEGAIKENADKEVLMVGSSMGGLLATLCARNNACVKALVLLAPGFGLNKRWSEMLGINGLEEWKTRGYVDVFHYALNANAQLGYQFIVDAENYVTDNLTVSVPALVIHGDRDETVPVEESIAFTKNNLDQAELHVLDSDHQLLDSLPTIWELMESFLKRNQLLKQSKVS
jgi:uncharacterized protein